jgi:hypothetical protein
MYYPAKTEYLRLQYNVTVLLLPTSVPSRQSSAAAMGHAMGEKMAMRKYTRGENSAAMRSWLGPVNTALGRISLQQHTCNPSVREMGMVGVVTQLSHNCYASAQRTCMCGAGPVMRSAVRPRQRVCGGACRLNQDRWTLRMQTAQRAMYHSRPPRRLLLTQRTGPA